MQLANVRGRAAAPWTALKQASAAQRGRLTCSARQQPGRVLARALSPVLPGLIGAGAPLMGCGPPNKNPVARGKYSSVLDFAACCQVARSRSACRQAASSGFISYKPCRRAAPG